MNTMQENKGKQRLAAILVIAMICAVFMPVHVMAASKIKQVKSLKVSSTNYNSLKVSWKKVKGAKGYQVYRATKKNGKYKRVKTIKKGKTVSWTNKKLTTGKRYYYKVRAYKGSRKGSFSAKKSGVPKLTKTSGIKASASSSSAIRVSWNKTSGASGYQVYRATSRGGKYSRVKTTSAGSYTNTGLSASKMYYYKVRSYRKVGKSTKYSSYSNTVSAKTRAKVATPSNPSKPEQPSNPTDPSEPSEPVIEQYLKIIDYQTGKEVDSLQAGKEYQIKSSNSSYIGTSEQTVGTVADENKAAQICYRGRASKLYPISKGSLWVSNKDGMKKEYPITAGVKIQTGNLTAELGGSVPGGYAESYDTIYGYRQYVYNKDKANLVLVGAEDGAVKTVFTMGSYSMNTDEEYVQTNTTSFGAVTIQPIRYYEYNTPADTILSGSKLDNLGKEANLIASSLRVKSGLTAMKENNALASATRDNVIKVYNYYGNSQNLDDNVHMISSLEIYENALSPEGCSINAENAVWGSYGPISVAVSAVEALYNSPGHRAWMFHEKSEQVGTAFMYDGSNYICALQAYAYKR